MGMTPRNPIEQGFFTPATYLRFAREWLKLEAWYAWHLVQTSLAPDDVLERRIFLFRRAYPGTGDTWEAWKPECIARLRACTGPDTAALEDWLLAADEPFLLRNLEAHFAKEYVEPLQTPFAGFSYGFTQDYRVGSGPDCLTLHFRNAFTPDSPFQHLDSLRASLRRLLEQATAERPEVTAVQCGSWLNSLPPFASLFPPGWRASATPGEPGAHMGWWGQFMDRTGLFHARNGAHLRQTGEFPHRHLLCACPLDELRQYLDCAAPQS